MFFKGYLLLQKKQKITARKKKEDEERSKTRKMHVIKNKNSRSTTRLGPWKRNAREVKTARISFNFFF